VDKRDRSSNVKIKEMTTGLETATRGETVNAARPRLILHIRCFQTEECYSMRCSGKGSLCDSSLSAGHPKWD